MATIISTQSHLQQWCPLPSSKDRTLWDWPLMQLDNASTSTQYIQRKVTRNQRIYLVNSGIMQVQFCISYWNKSLDMNTESVLQVKTNENCLHHLEKQPRQHIPPCMCATVLWGTCFPPLLFCWIVFYFSYFSLFLKKI